MSTEAVITGSAVEGETLTASISTSTPTPSSAAGISIAFDDNAFSLSPTFVSIDDYVIEWTARLSGRASEFEHTEGGSASLTLQNRSGYFDPLNATGPQYLKLQPMKQAKINVRHPLTGTYHDVFTGYTDTYSYHRQGPRGAETTLTLVDGFELLNQSSVVPGSLGGSGGVTAAPAAYYAAQHVDDRIKAALGDAGWDSSNWRIATGNVNCQAISYDAETPVLQVIQEAADAEFPNIGNFFMDKSGNAAFSGRGIRFLPASYGFNPVNINGDWTHWDVTNSRPGWRVGDAASCALDGTLIPMVDFTSSFGKGSLYNDVVCAPRGAEAETITSSYIQNVASVEKFGKRSLPLLDLLLLDGSTTGQSGILECRDYATYYVNNYSQVLPRIDSIEFHGQMDDQLYFLSDRVTLDPNRLNGRLWDFILGVEVNHLIEMHVINPGGGGMGGVNFFVEGITHTVSRGNGIIPHWTMTLDLSPRALYASYP